MELVSRDINAYRTILIPHIQTITQASTPLQAVAEAERFLSHVEWLFATDIRTPFYAEVAYLWAIFPARIKTLEKYKELITVLLEQVVDAYWYESYPHYSCEKAIARDTTLYSFQKFNADFEVKFCYVQYYPHVLMRVPNAIRLRYRRITNHRGQYTQGLTTTRCKKATAALINHIAETVATRLRRKNPLSLQVNSILRTRQYQQSLAAIGYVAPRYSAHLAGYALDLEKWWYERHDWEAHHVINKVLIDLCTQGVINVIDERTHWHICLNPDYISSFEALFQQWERK